MNLNRPELIESYLKGELSEAEKMAFEAQLEQDPLFKSELELQKDIVNSIKSYRKNQLKQRLNNIDVTATSFVNVAALKFAASLLVIGILSYGSYFFLFNNSEPETVTIKQEVKQEQKVEPAQTKEETVETVIKPEEIKPEIAIEESKPVEKKKPAIKKESREIIISPNVIDSFEEDQAIVKNNNFDKAINNSASSADKITEIEILHEDVKGKDLKYKYLNKKLYLYGDFNDSPYELIELNSEMGKKLFLFHNNYYYQLNEDQVTIAPLNPMSDSLVIQELDSLKRK
ncbi:MAG TPA: hypothetical protein VD908_10835 [Cytophagales bacterium]|nr:hypothetical protein [Cytophagales bacterium]